MKQLTEYIKEQQKTCYDGPDFFGKWYYDKMHYKYFNNETGVPSLEEIEDCFHTKNNVTGDPSWLTVDGVTFTKYEKNKWQASSSLARAIGGTINNKEIHDKLKNTKEKWYAMLRPGDGKVNEDY